MIITELLTLPPLLTVAYRRQEEVVRQLAAVAATAVVVVYRLSRPSSSSRVSIVPHNFCCFSILSCAL
jgi:hypothetical protein